jgi:cyclophilin family peptidyl-prolyl cis-trans isomerase/HEAT repeat protein
VRPAAFPLLALIAACARPAPSPKAPAPPPAPPVVSIDTKAAWILRLEDARVLRDASVDKGAARVPSGAGEASFTPAATPDLLALASDPDANIRRRALLAIGRVGTSEGLPRLVAALRDPDERVRSTAAFALGLVGAREGVAPLTAALQDSSPAVRGRAAEGLGLTADAVRSAGGLGAALEASTAAAIAEASAGCAAVLSPIDPDAESVGDPDVDACRLALVALVRLRQYDALSRVALDSAGRPVSRWWPVAFALQRIGDARAAPALRTLASTPGVHTAAFALRGLAAAKDREAAPIALALATQSAADVRLRVAAVRALAQVGGPGAVEPLVSLLADPRTPQNLALEVVTALGLLGDRRAFDPLLDLMTDPWPAMRAAVLTAAASVNPDGFLLVLASVDRDRDWSVRAALASVLSTFPADRVRGAIEDLTADADARVRGPALEALVRIGAPDLASRLFEALDAADFGVRATAARLIGETRPPGGVPRLVAAYARGSSDAAYSARSAAVEALARYGGEEAKAGIRPALADKEWPVRIRAADLLRSLGDATAEPARPAPMRKPAEFFESAAFLRPPFAPRAFIETRLGTIEIELNVVDAPLTSHTFVELARAGFFNGVKVHRLVPNFVIQAGDPRGDGEGGPGYTIRDEPSTQPYVRGTVGMALEWRDTAGSQFFITLSPQPHLDGKYTVFGRVVAGDSVLDQVAQGDVIERIRIWDGVRLY